MNRNTGKKILKSITMIFLLWFFTHTAYIVYDGFRMPGSHADIAVILGNKVNEDGSLSTRLKKRMETGAMLYKSGLVDKILVSGGLGKEGFWEGDKMKEYLIENNIPDSVIIVDNGGNNTELTVRNFIYLHEKSRIKNVIVVSQYFHITRIKQLMKMNGFDAVQGAAPVYFEWRDIYAIPREFIAYYTNIFK